jgi:hypothetical protein
MRLVKSAAFMTPDLEAYSKSVTSVGQMIPTEKSRQRRHSDHAEV